MEDAIKILKTTRPTFYRWLRSGKLKGMKVGRQWRFYRQDIQRFLKGQAPQIDLPTDVAPVIDALQSHLRKLAVKDRFPPNGNQLARAVNLMILLACQMRASDIHIESQARGVATVRYRLDGTLHPIMEIDIRLLPAFVNQWKTMAQCDLHETVKPQDGRILWDYPGLDRPIDLRISFVPSVTGESLTARILDPKAGLLSLEQMPFNTRDRERVERWIKAPSGMIIVTGPTGCGKTTTVYACINRLKTPSLKIMTVEDPVEYFLPGTTQLLVNDKAGLTIPTRIRSIIRSDPDVVMIAEVRDVETLELAVAVALTGHLVLTTMYTSEAATALQRMLELSNNPLAVGDATKLIVAQRLVRVLCPRCSVERRPPDYFVVMAQKLLQIGGVDWDSLPKRFREPVGCPACNLSGFRGRTLVAETLEVTTEVFAALMRRAPVSELRAIAVREGMSTIAVEGIRRAAEGVTSLHEVMRYFFGSYGTELRAG